MRISTSAFLFIVILWTFMSCQQTKDEALPILGFEKLEEGNKVKHTIPDFKFLNQDSIWISNERYKDKIYVADFFFTTCPSICPTVTRSMLTIYDAFENNNQVELLSYTLDPEYDNVQILKEYANNLEVRSDKWNFVTGSKDSIYDLTTAYFSVVIEDDEAPGGINHSGKILLVDKDRHIRAFCEGTDPDDVDDFIKDIKTLLREYED